MAERDLQAHLDHLIRIGIALSSKLDVAELLEMIVDESRRFTGADAGTLYIVDPERRTLQWKIVQNDTMGTRIGGTSAVEIDEAVFRPVPLYVEGQVNLSNVSAYVAHTGETVNIPDVYEAEGFDFTGPRLYDRATGYRSRSMLVVPLRNHEDDIIGVLQLLNAWDEERRETVPFSPEVEGLIASLASQAAVGITNAQLVQNLKNLFDAFIQATAAAIDEKSPYTAGHVRRVADLTMMIAQEIHEADRGLWRRLKFTPEELNALRIAAWMHDVGKITTPEYVVDKATKLETISDRIETVRTRYEVMRRDAEIAALEKKVALLEGGGPDVEKMRAVEEELEIELEALREELVFIERCNAGGEFMADEDLARLTEIASRTCRVNGEVVGRLTEDELKNLSIRKGTLTEEERRVINNHAAVSIRMLSQLPFSKALKRVPEFAGGHHEKLNGKGYPQGLTAEQLPLQARILAVADVFEALTAPDRPYRKPMALSQALKIIGFMVKDGELDGRIVELFRESGLVMRYARKELDEEQIDVSG